MSENTLWQNAVRRLRAKWATAERLQAGTCHCRYKELMISFRLPGMAERDENRDDHRESCGYWCSACNFSNAGSRPIEEAE